MEYIIDVLEKQNKALQQLMEYMKEEYSLLLEGKPEPLANIGFAMQDCISTIEQDRSDMIANLGMSLSEYCQKLPQEQVDTIQNLVHIVQSQENMCKEQSEYNRTLALGMIEQCRKNIAFIQENIAPQSAQNYMPSGAMQKNIIQGTLLEGRL